jgi:hypothetical protein
MASLDLTDERDHRQQLGIAARFEMRNRIEIARSPTPPFQKTDRINTKTSAVSATATPVGSGLHVDREIDERVALGKGRWRRRPGKECPCRSGYCLLTSATDQLYENLLVGFV